MLLMLVLCQKPRKCTVKRFGINPNTSTILSRKCENNFLIHFLLACRSKLSFFLLFYQIYLLMPGCYYFLLKFSSLLFCLLSFFFFFTVYNHWGWQRGRTSFSWMLLAWDIYRETLTTGKMITKQTSFNLSDLVPSNTKKQQNKMRNALALAFSPFH